MPYSRYFLGYSISVCENSERDMPRMLSDFDRCGNSLFCVIRDILKEYSGKNGLETIDEMEKTFETTLQVKFSSKNILQGIIESGDYGNEGSLVNIKTKERVAKNKEQADVLGFFYQLYSPTGYDRAILLLESIGVNGIKTVFTKIICENFKKRYPEYSLSISPLYSKEMFLNFFNAGKSFKLELTSCGLPMTSNDSVDRIRDRSDRKRVKTQLIVKGLNKAGMIDLLYQHGCLKNGNLEDDLSDIFEITRFPNLYNKNWESASLTITKDLDGAKTTQKTFQLMSFDEAIYRYDVPTNLYESDINSYYKNIAKEIHKICMYLAEKCDMPNNIAYEEKYALENDLIK